MGAALWEEFYSLSQPGLRELIAEYRDSRPAAAGGDGFEVFLDQGGGRNRLLYAKGSCTQAEFETRVTLHIAPVEPADLPPHSRGSGFENRDFQLPDYGVRTTGGECLAIVPLPDYPIAAIRTGQGGWWETDLRPQANPDRLLAAYRALAGLEPAARGVFDLYRQDNRLLYLKETCAAADTAAGFFLHIIPEDVADLPAERRDAGFANRDFAFDQGGGPFDGKCLAIVALPDYPIAAIRTGQYVPGQGQLWAVELAEER